MHLMYFTEQPMSTYPSEEAMKAGHSVLLFSNRHFDPQEGSRLYNERMEEYVWAEECGVDGIMLNEHHNSSFCMQAKTNIFATVLAAKTERVKIVLLGNVLPVADNPIQLAEELAMIDMLSKGRLVSGFVRGGGPEQLATNTNPAYNRERFEEAHDLLIKSWTVPGPFRWEGTHYQMRVVNPWAVPLQKPHPPVWVPGTVSRETIEWAARHRYPYICLSTTAEQTQKIWEIYAAAAAEVGFTPGPQHRGYLMRCHVQDTREKAKENARQFQWMQGEFTGVGHPAWSSPSGYGSPSGREQNVQRTNRVQQKRTLPAVERELADLNLVYGTPDECVNALTEVMKARDIGIMALWANDGLINHQDSMRCIELLGKEVVPALRDKADELGLVGPFEVDEPVGIGPGIEVPGNAFAATGRA